MLRALLEAGIVPDLVVGTSVGAINGVVVAEDPTTGAVQRLADLWLDLDSTDLFGGSVFGRLSTLARTRTSLHTDQPLRDALTSHLAARTFEELHVPFQCVAANVEQAAEHWFSRGPLIEAVLASCAVPGLLPPVQLDGRTYLDGGLVHSIPVGRAVALGARTVYVLHVGRIERPLEPPRRPWEVGLVAFEIARRHRFAEDMASLPPEVTVHILPAGTNGQARGADLSQLRYRDVSRIDEHIQRAYAATTAYLAGAASAPG